MKRSLPGLCVAALIAICPIILSARAETQEAAPGAAAEKDRAAVLDSRAYLQRLEKLGFAGAILVARDKNQLLAEGYGLADRERGLPWTPATVSCTGSITKQFTGAAILKLEEEGHLRVTDPISSYFKDVPADKTGITLHHLLTHSSGLLDPEEIGDYDPIGREEYVRKVLAQKLAFPPGEGYEYANANFSLLGIIIEQLSGGSYESYLREKLFLPCGMRETGYLLPRWGEGRTAQGYRGTQRWGTILERPFDKDGPYWALRANGGIHSTCNDMFLWARALMEGKILSPESMKKYWTPHVSEGGDTFYGYGWSIATAPGGLKVVTHNGGNGIFFADMAMVPDAGLVIFLMTNVVADVPGANALLDKIRGRFLSGRPYPEVPDAKAVPEDSLKSLVGTYVLAEDGGRIVVAVEGRGLVLEPAGQKAFSLLHSVETVPPGRFERLNRLMDRIIAANRTGDFGPLVEAYGGRVPVDRIRERWLEITGTIEERNGRILRHEILGTARTTERDETVVRFVCEKGSAERTYVWAADQEASLMGMSMRGLPVRLRFVPEGGTAFASWDGGLRPSKRLRFEQDTDGKMTLKLGAEGPAAVRK